MVKVGLSVLLLSLSAACSAPAIQPDMPALLTNPDADTHLEIMQSVSAALNGSKITIAADALTKSSTLIIERRRLQSIDRPSEIGRDLGRPEHFQLVTDGPQCILIHQQTGVRWLLKKSKCIAE